MRRSNRHPPKSITRYRFSLFSKEPYLIPSLLHAGVILQFFEGDLRSPCVRKYSIVLGNYVGRECGHAEFAIDIELWETNYSTWTRGTAMEKDYRRFLLPKKRYRMSLSRLDYALS
jgi:hypothetical protein